MEILVVVIVILLCYLYSIHRKHYAYWKDRNVPSLPALPLFGSYLNRFLMKEHGAILAQADYEKYQNAKFIGGFRATHPELILRDPQLIKTILLRDFNYFVDRGTSMYETGVLGQLLVYLEGDKWRALRHKLTPTFTSSKLKKMFPLMVECSQELQRYVQAKVEQDDRVSMSEMSAKFTTDLIGLCAFGLKMDSIVDDNSPFRIIGRKFFKVSRTKHLLRLVNVMLPFIKLKARSDTEEIEEFFLNLVKQIITSRGKPSGRDDFMDLMMELKLKGSIEMDKNDTAENYDPTKNYKLEITDEIITAQALVFFAAGFETSSTTMATTFLELAFNPDVQAKLQLEIDSALKDHNGVITYDMIQNTEYLNNVIDESLRLHPPIGFLNRICTSKYQIPETDIVLDKGVRILVPTYAIHTDPKHFPEPEKFLPERFSKEAAGNFHPFAYLPFGEGPRICIGARFAKVQTAVGLITVLKNYSLEVCDRTPKKMDVEPKSTIMMADQDVILRLKPRT